MADLNYKLAIDTKEAERSLNSFKGILSTLAVGAVAREFIQFADSVTSLRNRFLQLNPSLIAAQDQLNAVAQIAIAARTPLEQTGDLYFRIARASETLGISQQEAARITETLAKAMTASGLSAQEAAGPLLQLGQALQSGRFQGDELRSILEGMPAVAQALANSLGVPVGQLRKLGAEGKITGEVFVKAMQQARSSVLEGFTRTTATAAQSFEILKTRIALAADQFMTASRGSEALQEMMQALARAIEYLTANIETVVKVVKILISVFLTYLALVTAQKVIGIAVAFYEVAKGLIKAKTAMEALNLVTKKNPLLLLATIGAAALTPLIDKFLATSESAKVATEDTSELQAAIDKLNNTPVGPGLTDAQRYPEAADNVRKLSAELSNLINQYKLSNQEQLKNLQTSIQMLALDDRAAAVLQARTDAEIQFNQKKRDLEQEIVKINADSKASTYEKGLAIEEVNRKIQELTASYNEFVPSLERETENLVASARASRLKVYQLDQELEAQKKLRDIQDEIAQLTMTSIEKKYYAIEAAARESAEAEIAAEAKRRNVENLSAEERQKYYDAALQRSEQLKEKTREHYEESRKWSTGWTRAFETYKEAATDAAKQAEDVFTTATRNMEEAIVNFAKTGKFEWRNFVSSIVEELLRQQVRELIAKTFPMFGLGNQSKSGGGGGLFGAIGNLLGFANGGIIPTNGPVLVGERGPELLMGARGRQVVPNNELGGVTNVVYNINAVDAASFKQLVARDPGFIYAVSQQGAKSITRIRR